MSALEALKELVQAAGLAHPNEITAWHIARRTSNHEVNLLAHELAFVKLGALLAAGASADWRAEEL